MYSLKESHILTRNQMHKLLYLERCGGVEFHLGTLDEDRAVREREAHASDVRVTERLPAVSLVGFDLHGVKCRVERLKRKQN